MNTFDKAFDVVVGVEGGLSMDRGDPGNWTGGKVGVGQLHGTNWGISAAVYPSIDMSTLTQDAAKAIYLKDYWQTADCDKVGWPLNLVLFDAAVNCGPEKAIKLMQEAIGVQADGDIGPTTLAQIRHLGVVETSALFMRRRVQFYQGLSGWPRYGAGWVNRLFRVAFRATG